MKVTTKEKAWAEANKIFPTDYDKDEAASQRAGYDIYRHHSLYYYNRICDLGCRLEVITDDGATTTNIWIEPEQFGVEVIARGAFVDTSAGENSVYLIETYVLRLNHIALNAWIMSETMNCRECYQDGIAGDAEWKAHKEKYAKRRETWKSQIIKALGLYDDGSINITQSQSEVFTVVHITKQVPKQIAD